MHVRPVQNENAHFLLGVDGIVFRNGYAYGSKRIIKIDKHSNQQEIG